MDDITRIAEQLARQAHAGQVDKQGRDYADHHLAPVAHHLEFLGPQAVAAGWLHDIIEDTPTTAVDLYRAAFPAQVIRAVHSVTRQDGETYADLIQRAASDPLGRFVKLADNWVNLSGLGDLAVTDPEAAARLRPRYERARRVLLSACGLWDA